MEAAGKAGGMKVLEATHDGETWFSVTGDVVEDNAKVILGIGHHYRCTRWRHVPDALKGDDGMTDNRAKLVTDIRLLLECETGKWTELLKTPTRNQEESGEDCVMCKEYNKVGAYHCTQCPLGRDYLPCDNFESPWSAWKRNPCFSTALAMHDAIVASRVRREERLRMMDDAGKGVERSCKTCADRVLKTACEACELHPTLAYWTNKIEDVERECGTCASFPKNGPPSSWIPGTARHLCDPRVKDEPKANSGKSCKDWTPAKSRAVEIIGLQTDVETLQEELKRVNALVDTDQHFQVEHLTEALADVRTDLAVAQGQVRGFKLVNKASDVASKINKATIRNMGDERVRLREKIMEQNWRLAKVIANVEHFRKYARHRESCAARVHPSSAVHPGPCTCGFDNGQKTDDKDWTDDANRHTAEQLEGRSVTILAHTRGDTEEIVEFVGPDQIAKAILDQHSITILDTLIDFPAMVSFSQELGVFDAKIRIGVHKPTVKVWIVKDDTKPRVDPPTFAGVLRLIRTVACHAMPLGQSGALLDIVDSCNALLGEDS